MASNVNSNHGIACNVRKNCAIFALIMTEAFIKFMGHDAGPLAQFVKYSISGGVATVVHMLVFHLAAWRLFPALESGDWAVKVLKLDTIHQDDCTRSRNSMYSNGIAFVFSNMAAYLLNVAFVFQSGRHHFVVEILLFYLVSGVSVVIGTALMGVLIRRFGMLTTYAFISNIFASLMINYAMRRFFIFAG